MAPTDVINRAPELYVRCIIFRATGLSVYIWKGGDDMSNPSAPYYYKVDGDTYHWETSCSKNHYPADGWKKTWEKPSGKEQCNECKSK